MTEFYEQSDDLDFWENMGDQPEAQEAEATPVDEGTPAEEVVAAETPVVASDGEETETVEETQGRPRDENGRFIKAEPEVDYRAELEALQQRLAAKDEFNGRLSNELGELRKQIQEGFSKPQAPSSWDDLIEENPAQAVAQAYDLYKAGDPAAEFNMRRAAQAWEEISPGAPALWAENVRLRQETEQRFAQIEQRTQPVVQQTEDQARARAYLAVKAKHSDIEQHVEAMQQVSTKFPALVTAIESGSPQEAEQGWEALYLLAKAGKADTLQQTAQEVARNALDGEQRVRQEAAVASAATVPGKKPLSLADRIGEEWDTLVAPLEAGWQL